MSRTARKSFFPGWIAVAGVMGPLVCAVTQSLAVPLTFSAQQRDGKPLAGAVITLDAQGTHLPPAAPVHAILDQVDLAFVPDIVVVPVGSTISFPNSDAVSHQVYSFSPTRRFQLPLYRGKPYPPMVFDQPGVVTLGCNIHDNMLAYVVVTEAPFFGLTDAKGKWAVPDLPSGSYRLHLWHPLLNEPSGAFERVVEASAAEGVPPALRLIHALRPAPLKGRPHSWDY